ncbi:unnamed protein product [Chrysoparadoxa australica]
MRSGLTLAGCALMSLSSVMGLGAQGLGNLIRYRGSVAATRPTSLWASSREGAASSVKRRKRLTSTGGLKGLPITSPSVELLAQAVNKSKKVKQDMDIKNARNRSRKWTAERMDTLAKEISKPLRTILQAYKYQLRVLHPFEATVADLTVRAREQRGQKTLENVLSGVNELRKGALEIGKAAATLGKTKERKTEVLEVMDNGYAAMAELFAEEGHAIQELIEVQKALRGIPVVELSIPTMVLVGAPNVGKSSIVRSISTGTPEVNNYPFTTRGMSLGHLFHPATDQRYQIMDTPGVLSRPDEERNAMEALTLASMQHLPTAVMFVMDLSGQSGNQSSVEKQIEVRNELRKRFPKRPWVDIISKADLPREKLSLASAALDEGYIDVSVVDGTGIEELTERVYEMMEVIEGVLQSTAPVLVSDEVDEGMG